MALVSLNHIKVTTPQLASCAFSVRSHHTNGRTLRLGRINVQRPPLHDRSSAVLGQHESVTLTIRLLRPQTTVETRFNSTNRLKRVGFEAGLLVTDITILSQSQVSRMTPQLALQTSPSHQLQDLENLTLFLPKIKTKKKFSSREYQIEAGVVVDSNPGAAKDSPCLGSNSSRKYGVVAWGANSSSVLVP
ncbi:hypothetical protein TNCV_1667241 [Trichonephila clavipes]|nr:hypothetical protein TNCV_1667241 [Trichonephila clavipes]